MPNIFPNHEKVTNKSDKSDKSKNKVESFQIWKKNLRKEV